MVFWRSKITKPVEPSADAVKEAKADIKDAAADDEAAPVEAGNPDALKTDTSTDIEDKPEASNVVSLASNRLAERLSSATIEKDAGAIQTSEKPARKSTSRSSHALIRSLSAPLEDGHVLVIAPVDADHLQSIVTTSAECASAWPAPKSWVAAAVGTASETIPVFPIAGDDVSRLVTDANSSLQRIAARVGRIAKSDDFRLSLDTLAEECDHAIELPLEQLKRRAEAQNIAVVKTLDGFVLAPMHDGRVVRQDVFRALPETLQRDVETKISTLESELHALVAREPEAHLAAEQKLEALAGTVVRQAAFSEMANLRAKYADQSDADDFVDYLERSITARGQDWLVSGQLHPFEPGAAYRLTDAPKSPGQVGAAVVRAMDSKSTSFTGNIGRDADGRLAVRGGYLIAADGGLLILEGWRLAADPQSWVTLSAALETGYVTPTPAAGLIVDVAPIAINLRVVLCSDEATLTRLEAIDPGIMKHFPTVVRLTGKDVSS